MQDQEMPSQASIQDAIPPSQGMDYMPVQQERPDAVEWILSSPSIPLDMKQEFWVLWENGPLSNFHGNDIPVLMAKFEEWSIMLLWSIPEPEWGEIKRYRDTPDGERETITMDLNRLINSLWSLYFMNLSRGREGFTLKELRGSRVWKEEEHRIKQDTGESGRPKLF